MIGRMKVLLLGLLIAAATFVWVNPASALVCTDTEPLVALSAPSYVAWGRVVPISLEVSPGVGSRIASDVLVVDGSSQVAYTPAEIAALPFGEGFALTLRPRRGIRSVDLQVAWTEEVGYAAPFVSCPRAITGQVVVGKGKLPTVRRDAGIGPGSVGLVMDGFPLLDINGIPFKGESCSVLPPGPLVVELSQGRRRWTMLLRRDACFERGRERRTRTRTWEADAHPDTTQVFLSFADSGPTREVVGYRIRIGRVTVERGRVIAMRRFIPERTIWQGTDDFVNVCINDLLTIRSSGGRLYCYIEAETVFGIKVR